CARLDHAGLRPLRGRRGTGGALPALAHVAAHGAARAGPLLPSPRHRALLLAPARSAAEGRHAGPVPDRGQRQPPPPRRAHPPPLYARPRPRHAWRQPLPQVALRRHILPPLPVSGPAQREIAQELVSARLAPRVGRASPAPATCLRPRREEKAMRLKSDPPSALPAPLSAPRRVEKDWA